ncbi:hypothetical protein FDECE_7917 [Fusarium decemcellulare]|nr:hypothetical protein FDECE_7917 [Fusarium decemcellulare]
MSATKTSEKRDDEMVHDNIDISSVAAGTMTKVEEDAETCNFYRQSISDSYRLKSALVGRCMQEIGMGTFHWRLFLFCGLGGMIDNFWSQGLPTVQPPAVVEFSDTTRITFSSIAYYVGLILGASFWGTSSDVIGRKPAFTTTLLLGGIFGVAVGGARDFITFCALWAVIGTAAGGNVPVDNMLFLEFLPASHQYLLTAISAWWIFGQLIVSLIGWVLIANFSAPGDSVPGTVRIEDNMGWRYVMFTLGGIAILIPILRPFIFKMPESPRNLLARGRDADVVESVNFVARANRKPEPLALGMLQAGLDDFKAVNLKSLFATRKLARHTAVLWTIWFIVGIAFPLYFNFLPLYLSQHFDGDNSLNATYRNYCIQSAVGVVGPIAAAWMIQTRLGRRYVMALGAVATGVFLFAYTAARSSSANLAFSSISGMIANFVYAILFAFTPESFPAPHRGIGCGLAAALLRIGGLIASFIGTYTDFTVVPIYVAAAMWCGVGLLCCALPFETHDHAAM